MNSVYGLVRVYDSFSQFVSLPTKIFSRCLHIDQVPDMMESCFDGNALKSKVSLNCIPRGISFVVVGIFLVFSYYSRFQLM